MVGQEAEDDTRDSWNWRARDLPSDLLADGRPARVSEQAWAFLIAYTTGGKRYAELASEAGCSPGRVQQLVQQAAQEAWNRRRLGPDPFEGLPQRERNCLTRSGYKTPDAVRLASDAELLAMNNLGKSCLRTIRKWLASTAGTGG